MFYLISLSDTLKWTTGILAIIIFIIAFYYHGEKNKYAKRCFIVGCISLVICLLLPSKDICYKMLIASQVTTENIENAKETVKDVADYIIEATKNI
jgi:hypothetical protein